MRAKRALCTRKLLLYSSPGQGGGTAPQVFSYKGYDFFFFSNEGNPREPIHIHVRHGKATAKFWIEKVEIASSYGFSAKTLRRLRAIIEDNKAMIERTWNEYFDS